MARQIKMTPEVIDAILESVAKGKSLAAACREYALSNGNFLDRVAKDAELEERYVRAREAGIDAQADEMHDLEHRVLSGEIDAAAYRAAMDARKWRMARQAPKKYGDKMQQEVSGGDKPVSVQFAWADND